jgi:hypothetical protein
MWIVDAHRDDGKSFVVRAEEILTAFLELERVPRETIPLPKCRMIWHNSQPCSLLIAFPWEGQEIDCKMQSNSR